MVRTVDVAVVGGGPAGLAAAIAARQRGFAALVIDGSKPPIDKPCGEGLMPDALAALRRLGVEIASGEGFVFRGVTFLNNRESLSARFPGGTGIGLRRTILHQKMRDRAAEVGVQFMWQTPVTGIAPDGVRLAGGGVVAARWIVGADGGQSLVRRWARLGSSNQKNFRFAWRGHFAVKPWSDHVEIYWVDGAEAYVTPVADREVCVVVASRKPKGPFSDVLMEFPGLARQLRGDSHHARSGEPSPR